MNIREISEAISKVEAAVDRLASTNKRVATLAQMTRVDVQQILQLSEVKRGVYETICGLQLRLKVLRNIKMNWPVWQKQNKHIDVRLNQLQGLEQFVRFLEDDNYEFVLEGYASETEASCDKPNPLICHYVQPTGAGKTGLIAIETALAQVKTLMLVPFDNLMYQTADDFQNIGGIAESDIAILPRGADEQLYQRPVLISTYAGHMARMRRNSEYVRMIQENVELVWCDEGHMALGKRTQEVIDGIDQFVQDGMTAEDQRSERSVLEGDGFIPSKAIKVAVTATPKLAAKHVRQKFGRCIGRVYQAELVRSGINVPYRIIHTDGHIEDDDTIIDAMTEAEEVKILDREKVYTKLLSEYADALVSYRDVKKGSKKNEQGMPIYGMAFCTNHAECERFVEDAAKLGLKFEILTGRELAKGETGRTQLKAAETRLQSHEIDGFVTVEKLATGYSPNFMNTILWARVTSSARTVQGIGRGGRRHTYPSDAPKTHCTVIETNWTLSRNATKGKKTPLRLADALEDQGEDAEAICGMANGAKLDVRKPVTQERARELITTTYAPTEFAILKSRQRKGVDFAGTGLGLKAIAVLFGVEGNPFGNNNDFHALGSAIYGEAYGDPEDNERSRVRTLITNTYTSTQFASLKTHHRGGTDFAGTRLGLVAIATLFGVEGDPVGNTNDFHALGSAIYGEAYGDPEDNERSRVRILITRVYTATEFSILRKDQRRGTDFAGTRLGLGAIATLFGVEGEPASNTNVFHTLGRAIYGEAYGDPEDNKRDHVRTLIAKAYTPTDFASLKKDQRKGGDFAGSRLGLKAIAVLFRVEGNPIGYTNVFHALGRAIYGEAYPH